jgi:hypothetical protein
LAKIISSRRTHIDRSESLAAPLTAIDAVEAALAGLFAEEAAAHGSQASSKATMVTPLFLLLLRRGPLLSLVRSAPRISHRALLSVIAALGRIGRLGRVGGLLIALRRRILRLLIITLSTHYDGRRGGLVVRRLQAIISTGGR